MINPQVVKSLRDRLVASGVDVTLANKVQEVFSLQEVQIGIGMAMRNHGVAAFRTGVIVGVVAVGLVVLAAKYVF